MSTSNNLNQQIQNIQTTKYFMFIHDGGYVNSDTVDFSL